MTDGDLSIVIPTAFRMRSGEVERRILALIRSGQFAGQEVIVSHGEWADDGEFLRKIEGTGARLVVTHLKSESLPLGLLRNRGAELATAKWLLFWDVDLVPQVDFLDQLRRCLSRANRPFAIVPCLYATSDGTSQFVSKGAFNAPQAVEAFYAHRRDLIQHLALNTSTVAIERTHYFAIGGFDERYLDHGLEDLDLLVRLALEDDSLPIPTDLFADERRQSPAFAGGFRSVLNLLSLPVFLDGLVTLHQWHRRPRRNPYYQRREKNYALFEENVRAALRGRPLGTFSEPWQSLARSNGTLDSILAVHRFVSRAVPQPKDVSALFDEVPQFYFHPDRSRRRLVQGLLRVLGRQKPKNS